MVRAYKLLFTPSAFASFNKGSLLFSKSECQATSTFVSSQQFYPSSHKMSGLDIFVLIVYIALLNPVLYCLWKHGKPGILAWLPLQSFCILRIVGSILDLHNAAVHSTNEDALIFNNVGLSPLLLAAAGVLHEA